VSKELHIVGFRIGREVFGVPISLVHEIVRVPEITSVPDSPGFVQGVINLRGNAACAFVIGGMSNGDERTVQVEGIVDEPTGTDLERLKGIYFARFPDGRRREHSPGVMYLRLRPRWLRFSDFNQSPAAITELTF